MLRARAGKCFYAFLRILVCACALGTAAAARESLWRDCPIIICSPRLRSTLAAILCLFAHTVVAAANGRLLTPAWKMIVCVCSQLGVGSPYNAWAPVEALCGTVLQLALGYDFTCAVLWTGSLTCFGINYSGACVVLIRYCELPDCVLRGCVACQLFVLFVLYPCAHTRLC